MDEDTHWLAEEKYAKFKGIYRLQLNMVFEPFKMYGQEAYIPGAIDEIVKLSEYWCMSVRGIEKPISIEYVRRKK